MKSRSTAVDILEELALVHEIPKKVLQYRELTKLKSTYADVLPRLIHPLSRSAAHALRSDGNRHGTPQLSQSEFAEYSDTHRSWVAKFERHLSLRRETCCFRPTIRRSNCGFWRIFRKIRFWWMHSAAAKTFTLEPRRKFSTFRRWLKRANTGEWQK